MHHYEIVLVFHPDQSEQVPAMVQRYIDLVTKNGGQLHRREDWGRRPLAYPIGKINKAHYILLNIECNQDSYQQLCSAFRFNDAIIRELVLRCDQAITENSLLLAIEKNSSKEASGSL